MKDVESGEEQVFYLLDKDKFWVSDVKQVKTRIIHIRGFLCSKHQLIRDRKIFF